MIKKNNVRNGFTLIELLAVIVLLGIVSGLAIYVGIHIIKNTREKNYQVTVNNVEKAARDYTLEYKNNLTWLNVENNSNYIYQCITIKNLIDTGYFKGELSNSLVSDNRTLKNDDLIYIEIDSTNKNIVRNNLILNEGNNLSELCNRSTLVGDILIDVPSGYALNKEVLITYKLSISTGLNDGYMYNYVQDNDSSVKLDKVRFTSLRHEEKVVVNNNGWLSASIVDTNGNVVITSSKEIVGIDKNGPLISSGYNGNSVVRNSVIIPIRVTDEEAGLSDGNLNLSNMEISIGDKVITDGITLEKIDKNNYNLKISNYIDDGQVKIKIVNNSVFDVLGNGNDEVYLTPNVSFVNIFKIKYNANGGSGTMGDTECRYGKSCGLAGIGFSRSGYSFLGWSESSYATSATYGNGYVFSNFNYNRDITLYAIWKKNPEPPSGGGGGGSSSSGGGGGSSGGDSGSSSGSVCISGYMLVNGKYCCEKGVPSDLRRCYVA